ncbi:class I SAM-dependent methyltransferase [bacterium]|nr:class I SAM-dependent methyltransferase [bacterium]
MKSATSIPTITYEKCPSCQDEKISSTLSAKDYTVSHQNFEIWECNNCGLRFTQHIPVEKEIGAYYQAESYISHSNTSKGFINRIYQTVRNFTLKQKLKLVRKASGMKTGRLLDIGCGTGEFPGTMQNAGWEVTALEPDEGARNQAINNFGLDVSTQEALFELETDSYDVITMWHVLEHVHRLHPYLDKIHQLLRKNGTLIIAVPNFECKDQEIYGEHWAAYDVPRHLYHFSPGAMEQLLEGHGFSLKKMKIMPFDAFYVSMLSETYKHGKSRLLSSFWTGFRSWLQSVGKAERSSSVMYLVEKK